MFIKKLEVKNFRSIRDSFMDCNNLSVLLGRNGAGKSTFLHAIDYFYDVAASLDDEDFFERDTELTIEIRITYGDLREEEIEEFRPYIQGKILIVTKKMKYENSKITQKYFAAIRQIPQFAEIRKITGKRDRVTAWKEFVRTAEIEDLSENVKSADQVDDLMLEYENSHSELMQPIEKEEQFFGPKNIGGGKLDKYTKLVFIPAVREAYDEISGKKGAVYQLLDMIILRKINAREDIQKFKSEYELKIRELYSSENLTELPELGMSISETLEKFAPGSKLQLGWDEVTPPTIPLPSVKATLIEDNFEGDITHKGHGLQRALIVTLLQHLAMAIPERIGDISDEVEPSESLDDRFSMPDLILAFEEPELYLHPSRCRYLANLLLQLSENPGTGLGSSNQIFYTSHSPYFVDLHRFDKIRIIRKISSPDSEVPQSYANAYSLEGAASELARICNTDTSEFTRESFKVRAMSVMNTIVNEGFFADVVVVVEGITEVCTLWNLQEKLNKDWHRLGIVVVPAGGKNNLDRPVVIFRGLVIPTYFIFDADSDSIGRSSEEEAKKRNHIYLRLANAEIENFPDTQVHDNWAVFKVNLEKLLKNEIGNDNYVSIRREVAEEIGHDDIERACKNMEGASRFIEKVYDRGFRSETLEKIIKKITNLRSL